MGHRQGAGSDIRPTTLDVLAGVVVGLVLRSMHRRFDVQQTPR